jgi:hypothetical protein
MIGRSGLDARLRSRIAEDCDPHGASTILTTKNCIGLLARPAFPPACFIARAETSFETDDLAEGTWLRAGVKGGSGRFREYHLFVRILVAQKSEEFYHHIDPGSEWYQYPLICRTLDW